MQIESLQCNHCGAEIEVSPTTRFATCAHCGSKLAVVRSAGAAYTELTEQVSELSHRVREHLDRSEHRDALADLDRQWDQEKENFMITNKHGVKHIPTRSESAIAGTVVTIFGVFWTIMALGISGFGASMFSHSGAGPLALVPCIFPAFGILFIGLGIYQSMNAYDKATRYERAKSLHESRRRSLLASNNDAENP